VAAEYKEKTLQANQELIEASTLPGFRSEQIQGDL
jgi:hypothetical protein